MANIRKRGNTYQIRVSCGYDVRGVQQFQSKTWKPEEGMTPKQIEKELIQIKNLSTRFDIKRINKIKKLICQNNNAGYFISEKDDKAICITGKYGYAYLLGCVNY